MREECPGHWSGHSNVYIFKEKWKKRTNGLDTPEKNYKIGIDFFSNIDFNYISR